MKVKLLNIYLYISSGFLLNTLLNFVGMIRSSVELKGPSHGQFTPAIRQFSAPKNVKSLEE